MVRNRRGNATVDRLKRVAVAAVDVEARLWIAACYLYWYTHLVLRQAGQALPARPRSMSS